MKEFAFILFFMSCSASLSAQIDALADSLYFMQTGKHLKETGRTAKKPVTSKAHFIYYYQIQRENHDFSMTNPTQLVADTTQQVSLLQFSYQHRSGGMHGSQKAHTEQNATVFTEGFTRLGRLKIGGGFRFNRQWQDSLANNLNAPSDGFSPYYYFTPKAGRYESQQYTMLALANYELVKNRFYIGVKADYTYHWTIGSVDPRIDNKVFEINFYPSLTYRHKNTFLGLTYLTGFGNNDVDIRYKSKVFSQSNLFPERFFYLNMGYGNIALKYDIIKKKTLNNKGLAMQFYTKTNRLQIRANLAYEKNNQRNKKKLDTLQMTDLFSKWNQDRYSANFLLTYEKETVAQQFSIQAELVQGKDYNSLYHGQNYTADHSFLHMGYVYQQVGTQSLQWQYGAFINFTEGKQKDILAAHHTAFQHFQPGISGTLYLKGKKNNFASFELSPSLILPLKNTLEVPSTQLNTFTKNSAYPDFYYREIKQLEMVFQFTFMTPYITKTNYIGIFANTVFRHGLSTPEDRTAMPFEPIGHHRLSVNLGMNIYL